MVEKNSLIKFDDGLEANRKMVLTYCKKDSERFVEVEEEVTIENKYGYLPNKYNLRYIHFSKNNILHKYTQYEEELLHPEFPFILDITKDDITLRRFTKYKVRRIYDIVEKHNLYEIVEKLFCAQIIKKHNELLCAVIDEVVKNHNDNIICIPADKSLNKNDGTDILVVSYYAIEKKSYGIIMQSIPEELYIPGLGIIKLLENVDKVNRIDSIVSYHKKYLDDNYVELEFPENTYAVMNNILEENLE